MTRCEEIRSLMMDYIYDEMTEEERKVFELHLSGCPECRAEVVSLKKTSGILGEWVEPEPDIRVIAVKERSSISERFKDTFGSVFFRPKRLVFGSVYALVAIFLILSLANTEISINNGNFSMSMSLMKSSKAPQTEGAPVKTNLLVEELVRENYQLTRALIEESEVRQEQKLAYVLSSFKKGLDEERYQDLNLVQYGFTELQRNTYQQVREIDGALKGLIRPAHIQNN